MPYVPGCQYDLFITYASENNRNGWVNAFKDVLTNELEELLGRQFSEKSVFLDKTELRAGQSFPETLERASADSAVLIPVLSPSYLTSEWCRRERLAFRSKLPHGATEAECLAPVVVRPVDKTQLDPLLQSAQQLTFIPENGDEPSPAGTPEWNAKVKKLAGQLKLVLEALRAKCRPVFVGRALPGREDVRALCVAELENRLFRVSPMPFLDTKESLVQTLQRSALSVHFIGGGSEDGRLAADLAAQVCPGATVLYRPYGANLTDDESLWLDAFEQTLPTGPRRYQRIEDKNDQELVSVLEQEITKMRPPAPAAADAAEVSVICDEPDLALARQLQIEMEKREEFRVAYPAFLSAPLTPSEKVRKYTELMRVSGALLFCWGQTRQEVFLEKLATRSGAQTLLQWYLAQPELQGKQSKHPGAICQPGDFVYDALNPFLDPIRRKRSGDV